MPKNTPTRTRNTAPYSIVERCFMNFLLLQKKINVAKYKNKKKNKTEVYTEKIAN